MGDLTMAKNWRPNIEEIEIEYVRLKWQYKDEYVEKLRSLCFTYWAFPPEFMAREFESEATYANLRREAEKNGIICCQRDRSRFARITRIFVTPFGKAWACGEFNASQPGGPWDEQE
jgi:hypothetical protein